jgi:hypothetical protein
MIPTAVGSKQEVVRRDIAARAHGAGASKPVPCVDVLVRHSGSERVLPRANEREAEKPQERPGRAESAVKALP